MAMPITMHEGLKSNQFIAIDNYIIVIVKLYSNSYTVNVLVIVSVVISFATSSVVA